MNQEVTDYINGFSDEKKLILTKLRILVHSSVDGTAESFKWSRPVFGRGKDFAYLKANKKDITLGFFNFHKIDDMEGILEGTGKDMRHIKFSHTSDINEDLLRAWLQAVAS